jgi:hypothetical protein
VLLLPPPLCLLCPLQSFPASKLQRELRLSGVTKTEHVLRLRLTEEQGAMYEAYTQVPRWPGGWQVDAEARGCNAVHKGLVGGARRGEGVRLLRI